jgi:hypothetical protein
MPSSAGVSIQNIISKHNGIRLSNWFDSSEGNRQLQRVDGQQTEILHSLPLAVRLGSRVPLFCRQRSGTRGGFIDIIKQMQRRASWLGNSKDCSGSGEVVAVAAVMHQANAVENGGSCSGDSCAAWG